MEETINDFEKIRQLFATETTENWLLAIILCQQLPKNHHQHWLDIFSDIESVKQQFRQQGLNGTSSFDLYQESAVALIQTLVPTFKQAHKAFHLASFSGLYFSVPRNATTETPPAYLIDLEHFLEKTLEEQDFAVFQLQKGAIKSVTQATATLLQQSSADLIAFGLPLLSTWATVYCQFNKKNQFTDEVRQWQPLAIQVLLYLQQQLQELLQAPKEVINGLTVALEELFYTSSLTLLQNLQEKEILELIVDLISVTSFPKEARQRILLSHALLKIPTDYVEEMSWRAMSDSNLYRGIQGEDITIYAHHFWQYQHTLEFERLNKKQQFAYQKAIVDLWAYYYVGALEPYLLFLQKYFPTNPDHYFYLGQLYHGTLNDPDKALYYFNRYLALNKKPLPANNHILTERIYNQRCYAPSAPEALTWIGQIHENKGDTNKAILTYQRAIDCYPHYHLSPYLPLVRILLNEHEYTTQAYQLLVDYYTIFYEQTPWNKKLSINYYGTANLKIGEESEEWMRKYEHHTGQDGDVNRRVGHKALIFSFYAIFFRFAEWYFYEELAIDKALEALVFCNKCKSHLYGQRYVKQWTYILEPQEVKEEDLSFLKAEIMLESYQDYWQAKSLYKQVLKLNPNHHLAKKGLQNIREKLGY
ncbi:MAG: tetratricopeptide repeat protein [Aureispira sp.]